MRHIVLSCGEEKSFVVSGATSNLIELVSIRLCQRRCQKRRNGRAVLREMTPLSMSINFGGSGKNGIVRSRYINVERQTVLRLVRVPFIRHESG